MLRLKRLDIRNLHPSKNPMKHKIRNASPDCSTFNPHEFNEFKLIIISNSNT
uniref:Uncharacterized protein n=1 Tax=Rhizophagus irregularis (strain DAOM 181602 / DAOM 197198 / MUCL 43194) TaxID=747089 RepID=U9UEV6_RHIID